ncbi:MAG: carboxymuconolactone decarboxylase family protein [Ilumatobacteraceae bacterium]
MRAERGYLLSYHEVLARTDPALLEAYRRMYSQLTLEPRHLDARLRELVWTGLLTVAGEHVGSLHLDRALAAGVTVAELRLAVRLAGATASWTALSFAHQNWAALLGRPGAEADYRQMVEIAGAGLESRDLELVLLVCAAARMCEEQFLNQLRRCYDLGIPEAEIAETVSYVMQPLGANTLLWATDRWLDALADGSIIAGEMLGDVSFDVRRT